MKQAKADAELFDKIEKFFAQKVERRVREGYQELERFLKKEIRLGKENGREGPGTAGREKDLIKEIEDFFEEKVERKVRDGYRELEKLLKKEIGPKKGKPSEFLEYDADSPFSYLSAFLRDKAVASVVPSTKFVVDRVVKAMELPQAGLIVEFGPAEGVITRRMLAKLRPEAVVVAIERNENFVKALGKIDDRRLRVVHGDVQQVDAILARHGLGEADAMVSGIPFSFFNSRQRHQLLEKILAGLKPKGRFVAYQFTTHLIPLLKCYFRKVDTQFEIRNLPPHFIFTCHK